MEDNAQTHLYEDIKDPKRAYLARRKGYTPGRDVNRARGERMFSQRTVTVFEVRVDAFSKTSGNSQAMDRYIAEATLSCGTSSACPHKEENGHDMYCSFARSNGSNESDD
jgi:hypothetical protein